MPSCGSLVVFYALSLTIQNIIQIDNTEMINWLTVFFSEKNQDHIQDQFWTKEQG